MKRHFVFDLDGVIRHWDPEIVARAERNHGLDGGTLLGTAFEPELLLSVVTGRITDRVWRDEIVEQLRQHYPGADVVGAVQAWSQPHGAVIAGSREVLARARTRGTVSLLSNATDRLGPDLAALNLTDAFDRIFNSAEIGFAKPDARVFEHVERALGATPERIVYIDDGAANIQTAAHRGWISLLATPETKLADLLDPYLD